MAEKNFTLEDIKNFLEKELKLKWFYDIFDYDELLFRKAKIEDFDRFAARTISVIKIRTEKEQNFFNNSPLVDIKILVTNNEFKVIRLGDYSEQWKELLANKQNTQTI